MWILAGMIAYAISVVLIVKFMAKECPAYAKTRAGSFL